MKYRPFGKLDFNVSALGFGVMRMPEKNGRIDEKEAIKMIRRAIEGGVNYIDTAYYYHGGRSEELVGKALKDGYRAKVKVATKLPCWKIESEADFDRYLEEQLKRLELESIDFYLLHALDKKTWPKIRDLGVFEWAEKAIAAGRLGHFGFSFHDELPVFKEIVDSYHWAMCLIQYNYMDKNRQAGIEGLRYAAAKNIAVAVMEPLLGGNLAKNPPAVQALWKEAPVQRTPVERALQWLWNQPEVATVLSGMSTMEQVEENLVYASRSGVGILDPEELALIDETRSRLEALTAIPCTGCSYCMPCPNDVNIPENLSLYNDAGKFAMLEEARRKYRGWKEAHENDRANTKDVRAAGCNACGECEARCPQAIPISSWMETVHGVLGEEKPFASKL